MAYVPNIFSSNYSAVCVSSCPNSSGPVPCLGSACPLSSSYKSISLGDVVCIPEPGTSSVSQIVNFNVLTQVFADLKICYWIFVGALAGSFIVGFIYFWLMRWCAGVIVWLSLAVFVLGSVAVGVYMFLYSKGIRIIETPFNLSDYSTNTLQYTSYALWSFAFLCVVFIICAFNRIRLGTVALNSAVAVVKSTSMYLS